jgi:hypothetical protein
MRQRRIRSRLLVSLGYAICAAAALVAGPALGATPTPRVGDPGSVFDPKKYDDRFPDAKEFAKAGVEGGIPVAKTIARKVKPGESIQAAVDGCPRGQVVLLLAGVHQTDKPIAMKSGVILRGENREKTVIEYGVKDKDARLILNFRKVEFAGVEDLTVRNAAVAALDPKTYLMKYDNYPGFKHDDTAAVEFVGAKNCWVQNSQILYSVSRPVRIFGDSAHLTLRDNLIDVALHKGGGGSGYYEIVGAKYVLLYNETIKNIRHLCLDGVCEYSVVLDCRLSVDVNWHTIAPMNHTLIEGCTSDANRNGHQWGLFSHYKDAVGKDNYIYKFSPQYNDGAVYGPVWSGKDDPGGYIQKKSEGPKTGTLYPVTGARAPRPGAGTTPRDDTPE